MVSETQRAVSEDGKAGISFPMASHVAVYCFVEKAKSSVLVSNGAECVTTEKPSQFGSGSLDV